MITKTQYVKGNNVKKTSKEGKPKKINKRFNTCLEKYEKERYRKLEIE